MLNGLSKTHSHFSEQKHLVFNLTQMYLIMAWEYCVIGMYNFTMLLIGKMPI